jgi:hypothetical protein
MAASEEGRLGGGFRLAGAVGYLVCPHTQFRHRIEEATVVECHGFWYPTLSHAAR